MAFTLADARSGYFSLIAEKSTTVHPLITTADVTTKINDAYEEFNEALQSTGAYFSPDRPPTDIRTSELIGLTASTQDYAPALATGGGIMLSVALLEDDGKTWADLLFIEPDRVAAWYAQKKYDNTTTGKPEAYTYYNGKLYLYPIPNYTLASGMRIMYIPNRTYGVVASPKTRLVSDVSAFAAICPETMMAYFAYLPASVWWAKKGRPDISKYYFDVYMSKVKQAEMLGIKKYMCSDVVIVDSKRLIPKDMNGQVRGGHI